MFVADIATSNSIDSSIQILMDGDSKYFNVSKALETIGKSCKQWDDWIKTRESKEIISACENEFDLKSGEYCFVVSTGKKKHRGTYVHEYLYTHILSWASPVYGIRVMRILDECRHEHIRNFAQDLSDDQDKLEFFNKEFNNLSWLCELYAEDSSDIFGEICLTDGQIEFLESIKPLSEWRDELLELECNDNFEPFAEEIWQMTGENLSYTEFYYLGVDQTPKVDDQDPRVIELNCYRLAVINKTPNQHYHGIADRAIQDFKIGRGSFERARNTCLSIIGSGIVSYNYNGIGEQYPDFKRELCEAVHHPNRIAKWIDAGNAIEDYLQ